MKKQLLVCVLTSFLFAGCNTPTDNLETDVTETETAAVDTVGAEMDNTRVEADETAPVVDSLLEEN